MINLNVEIADTPAAMAQGLMGRKDMPQDHGMLFKFNYPSDIAFWGKNTYLPLDIAFVDKSGHVVDIQNIVPMSTRLVRGKQPSVMAIEANQGFFNRHGIGIGTQVDLVQSSDSAKVVFKV